MKLTSEHQKACELIWQLWQAGEATQDLPTELKPASRDSGYAIQAHFEGFSSAPRYGWKIAATSSAGQAHIGVDGPLAGRLLAERVQEPGADISISGNRMRVCEPEFAFVVGREIPPRSSSYAEDEVMDAISDMHLTLELPDSRFAHFASVGGPTLIADNACAGILVVGPAVTADWRSVGLAAHRVTGRINDGPIREGAGANVLGDPRQALTWLVNEVSGLGVTLGRGELITTGTCMIPLEIAPGDRVTADFGAFGTITAIVNE